LMTDTYWTFPAFGFAREIEEKVHSFGSTVSSLRMPRERSRGRSTSSKR
jgi:hypothetical protein